jgi:hypothetical protein
LVAVAPDLDFARTEKLGGDYFSTDRRWRLFTPAIVSAVGTIDIMIPGDLRLQPEILPEMAAHPFAE